MLLRCTYQPTGQTSFFCPQDGRITTASASTFRMPSGTIALLFR